jgi:hypothetical protein
MLESDSYFADDMALAVPAWPCARLNLHEYHCGLPVATAWMG